MFLGLVEMTFGLVYSSFSLPKQQILKMTFLHPDLRIDFLKYIVTFLHVFYSVYNTVSLCLKLDYFLRNTWHSMKEFVYFW